ncbi:MAG: flagellar M-ring protein FliF [Calditrichaeota bacterium]|nr:MAG: flagellar M-ring protein FliF [Calditrichota bacterium]
MNDSFSRFRHQLTRFLQSLTPGQRIGLFFGVAGVLAVLMVILIWTGSPKYDILYSQLSQKDAGMILEKLKDMQVPYRLENGGATIMVPANKVYELRLQFAREGMPETSSVGYEIFDKTNLGMTDFLQKLNYRRALEGELTRTIQQMESVEKARVHIVIPEQSLFKEDQKQPTASVILKLKGTATPGDENIRAITHLVASSVEGLEPKNVTVIDTRGRVLSDNEEPESLLAQSTTQLEFTKKVEDYLSKKAQSMLDQVLGPGNAIVRVTAQLDFTKVEKTVEEYDPENPAVRSEEIEEQSTPVSGEANLATNAKSTSTVTNYELNRTVQHVVESVGNITHLSVAVLVNNKPEKVVNPDGKTTIKFVPRDRKEINTLADIVKRAVGFQQERGDEFSINNVDFSLPSLEEDLLSVEEDSPWSNVYNLIEKVFIVLAILASMIIMRSLFSQVKARHETIEEQIRALEAHQLMSLPGPSGGKGEAGALPDRTTADGNEDEMVYLEEFFKKDEKGNRLTQEIRTYVKENPETATRLLKVWLSEDER